MSQAEYEKVGKLKYFCGKNDYLGKGGFGYVFRGEFDGRPVAVKQIYAISDPKGAESEVQRCKAAKDIDHKNVVQYFHYEKKNQFM